jgi:hypothetical protein
MGRRKGEDTPAKKRRRLSHVAVVERSEPFAAADARLLEEECRRITNGQEFYRCMRWQIDRDVHVVHFAEAHQAVALEEWVRRNRFAERPAPKIGPSSAERAAFEAAAVMWGVRTGALRRLVLPPAGGYIDMAELFVRWAKREHWHWFYGRRKPSPRPWEDPADYPPADAYPHREDC